MVSSLEGFPSLCEQRGEDDPTVSWEGCEDRSVALLVCLPRFTLRRLDAGLAKALPNLQTEIVKRSDQAKAFVVLPKRRIVELTIAWLNRCRRLAKDFAAAMRWHSSDSRPFDSCCESAVILDKLHGQTLKGQALGGFNDILIAVVDGRQHDRREP
jgi:hypothetical protein